jgi:hypothetical protein
MSESSGQQIGVTEETIVNIARRCVQAFIQKELEEFATEEARDDFSDQLGRFKLFAGNVGIFAPGLASADYRLRDDKYLRDVIISILKQLAIEVKGLKPGILELVSDDHSKAGQRSLSNPNHSDIDSSTSSSTDSSSETDSRSGMEESIYKNKGSTIGEIRDLIDRLYSLSAIMRATNTLSEDIRVAKFSEKHKDTLTASDYISFVKDQIRRLCPDTTEELIARLSKAVIRRREKLLYRERHSQKLSQGLESFFEKTEASRYNEGDIERKKLVRFDLPSKNDPQKDQPAKIGAATKLSETKASTAIPIPVQRSYAKSKANTGITVSAIARRSHLDVPPPPKAPNGQELKCPYCPRLLKTSEVRKENWVLVIAHCDYICRLTSS